MTEKTYRGLRRNKDLHKAKPKNPKKVCNITNEMKYMSGNIFNL